MASTLDSSDEKTNGFKLMRLIVDGGTEALRETFTRHRSGNLHVVLSTYQPTLLKLKHRKIINQKQWGKLYPTPPNLPNINDFDITLLSILLRNICGLSPPCLGWDKMPNVSDHSVEAEIVRIRFFRNELFGHIPNTSVSTADFKAFWTEISSPLVHLGIHQKEIDRLENELCGKAEVERVMKEWNKCDSEIINALNDINRTLKSFVPKDENVLSKQLVWCNFQREIELYFEKFTKGTREWVFEQFLSWFNDETSKNRAFIISCLAGMGKSVIAAVICKRFAEHVGASHFFQYNNSQYNNPNILLQSLAWQLCQIVPAYKEALIEKLSSNLGQSLNAMNIEGLFSILFKEPFSGISDPGKRILIVLDAVDESEYYGRHELANLISNHLHKLPSYICFLITTRPEKNLIDKFEKLNPFYIKSNDERNLFDVKLVLQDKISKANAPTADLIDSLAEKSDGLMLYAFFLSEIYNEESSIFSIDKFPKGIEEHYESYFRRLECELGILEISEDKFNNFLSALAIAMEPLPEAFLETLFGLENSPRRMQKVRKAISSLLVIKEDKSISFFHKTIRDWLVDNSEHDYSVNEEYGHQILFDLCVQKLDELKKNGVKAVAQTSASVKYSIKYVIPHMLNRPEDSGSLDCFVSNYIADLEVLFASVCVNIDLTLINIGSLTNHEMFCRVSENKRRTLKRLHLLIKKFSFLLRDYPLTFLQNVVNEGEGELSSKAADLLQTRYKDIIYLEFVKKDRTNDALQARCLISGTISGIDLSPNHDYVVCSYKEGGIELFCLATCKSKWKRQDLMIELPSSPLRPNFYCDLCMLPNGLVFHPRGCLILPGRLDEVLTFEGTFTTGPFECDEGCPKFTNCCFSSDNSRMVTNYGNNLIVWNVLNGNKEKFLTCKELFSFSFTASGKFLGTIDIENVFNVYDIANDYNVKSITVDSQSPVEIVSTFEQNSWFCYVQGRIRIMNRDFTFLLCEGISPAEIVLPSNLRTSHELQCFLQHPEQCWFSKIKEIFNPPSLWYSCTALRYILVGDKSVLLYFCSSNAMYVFSIQGLINAEKQGPKKGSVFSNISANGDFVYLSNRKRITICQPDSNYKHSKPRKQPNQLHIPVVKDGVILCSGKCPPELWNSDLTQRLASFDQLAGTKKCLPVSDVLIACVYPSYVKFFNVLTTKIESETIFNENLSSVHACSTKYHVLAKIKSSDISLWKDGTRIDGWEYVFHRNTPLGKILFAEFSPQGNILALSSPEINKIFIFDVILVKFLLQIPIYEATSGLLRLKFFDNENLVCSSSNRILYLINVERGEILTCVDFDDIPAPIAVCRKRSIVFAALGGSECFELIKVCLPRNL